MERRTDRAERACGGIDRSAETRSLGESASAFCLGVLGWLGRSVRLALVFVGIVCLGFFIFEALLDESATEARAAESVVVDAETEEIRRVPPETPLVVTPRSVWETGETEILAVGFGDGGKLALAAGVDGRVRSWGSDEGKPGQTYTWGRGLLRAAWGSNGSAFVSVGTDNVLKGWRPKEDAAITGRTVSQLSFDRTRNAFLALSGDASIAAHANLGGEIQVVRLKDGTSADWRVPEGLGIPVIGLSLDGRLIALGGSARDSRSNFIEIRETMTGKLVRRLPGHAGAVMAVAFTPDASRVVSTGKDGLLRFWEVESGREVHPAGPLAGVGYCLAVSPNQPLAIVGTGHDWSRGTWSPAERRGVEVWDIQAGRLIGRLETSVPVTSVAVSTDGRLAISATEKGTLHVWEIPSRPSDDRGREVAPAIASIGD